jgi:hypothetical protein
MHYMSLATYVHRSIPRASYDDIELISAIGSFHIISFPIVV